VKKKRRSELFLRWKTTNFAKGWRVDFIKSKIFNYLISHTITITTTTKNNNSRSWQKSERKRSPLWARQHSTDLIQTAQTRTRIDGHSFASDVLSPCGRCETIRSESTRKSEASQSTGRGLVWPQARAIDQHSQGHHLRALAAVSGVSERWSRDRASRRRSQRL